MQIIIHANYAMNHANRMDAELFNAGKEAMVGCHTSHPDA